MEMYDKKPEDRERPPKGQKWANEGVICGALVSLAILGQVDPKEVALFETTREIKGKTLEKLKNFVEVAGEGRLSLLTRYSKRFAHSFRGLEIDGRAISKYQLTGVSKDKVEFTRTPAEVKEFCLKTFWLSIENHKRVSFEVFSEVEKEMIKIVTENQALYLENQALEAKILEYQTQEPKVEVPWYKKIFRRNKAK